MHTRTHIQAAITKISTYSHTYIHEHTHSLAPPVSVFRLIWCSRLCSRHSWSARVNRSCQTSAGRLRGLGTGGCRHTPPHDSPAGTPAQSHPPGVSLPPSLPSPPRWEDHLWTTMYQVGVSRRESPMGLIFTVITQCCHQTGKVFALTYHFGVNIDCTK